MAATGDPGLHPLDVDVPIWDRFFTVAPLAVIGTRDPDGGYDLAPKHMAAPLGWDNYFGFVCCPEHHTYRNIAREGVFTVSFPLPEQVVLASLAAGPRFEDDSKPSLGPIPTFRAAVVDGVFVKEGYLYLECELDRIVDGFGDNSLVAGRIVAAHVRDGALRMSDRDDHDLLAATPLLAYLAPGRYARIAESYSFPFHVGFRR